MNLSLLNDIPDVTESICKLFADDAKLFGQVHLRKDSSILQNDIKKIIEWSEHWQLPFNTGKCKSLNIGTSNPLTRYRMGDHELKQVSEEKDLGIVIDKDLKFRQQAAIAIKKANMHLGIIKRSFLCLDELVMPMLFKSLVRSHLEYGGNII